MRIGGQGDGGSTNWNPTGTLTNAAGEEAELREVVRLLLLIPLLLNSAHRGTGANLRGLIDMFE